MSGDYPRFLDSGESALVVEFGAGVDAAINDRVLALDEALSALRLEGIRETVPTYRSLMIHYDPWSSIVRPSRPPPRTSQQCPTKPGNRPIAGPSRVATTRALLKILAKLLRVPDWPQVVSSSSTPGPRIASTCTASRRDSATSAEFQPSFRFPAERPRAPHTHRTPFWSATA